MIHLCCLYPKLQSLDGTVSALFHLVGMSFKHLHCSGDAKCGVKKRAYQNMNCATQKATWNLHTKPGAVAWSDIVQGLLVCHWEYYIRWSGFSFIIDTTFGKLHILSHGVIYGWEQCMCLVLLFLLVICSPCWSKKQANMHYHVSRLCHTSPSSKCVNSKNMSGHNITLPLHWNVSLDHVDGARSLFVFDASPSSSKRTLKFVVWWPARGEAVLANIFFFPSTPESCLQWSVLFTKSRFRVSLRLHWATKEKGISVRVQCVWGSRPFLVTRQSWHQILMCGEYRCVGLGCGTSNIGQEQTLNRHPILRCVKLNHCIMNVDITNCQL